MRAFSAREKCGGRPLTYREGTLLAFKNYSYRLRVTLGWGCMGGGGGLWYPNATPDPRLPTSGTLDLAENFPRLQRLSLRYVEHMGLG